MFGWMRRSPNHLRRLNDFMAEQPAFDIGYIASEVSNQAVIEDVIFDRIRDRHRQMWQAQYSSFYAQLLQEPETRAALNAANGQLSALNDELAATDKMLETSDRKPEPWSALSVTTVILLILGYVIVASFSVTAFATFNIATDRAAYGEGGDYRAFFTSFIPAGAPLALEICYLRIPYATVRRRFQAAAFV
ncbi:MAG: hypothetical protein KDA53_16410, partial [Hyphomonas sp.]|nr:hypothetical protein [Hyphomonas sp.]